MIYLYEILTLLSSLFITYELIYSEIVAGVKTGPKSLLFAFMSTERWLATYRHFSPTMMQGFCFENAIANRIMIVLISYNSIHFDTPFRQLMKKTNHWFDLVLNQTRLIASICCQQ